MRSQLESNKLEPIVRIIAESILEGISQEPEGERLKGYKVGKIIIQPK